VNETDKVRTGQRPYEAFDIPEFQGKTGPVQPEHLMLAYQNIAQDVRDRSIDSLQPYGQMAQAKFDNEFSNRLISHLEKLHTEKDTRLNENLRTGFDLRLENLRQRTMDDAQVAGPLEAQTKAIKELNVDLKNMPGFIYSEKDREAKRQETVKKIVFDPYVKQMQSQDGGIALFKDLVEGKVQLPHDLVTGMSSVELLKELQDMTLQHIQKVATYQHTVSQAQNEAHRLDSDKYFNEIFPLARTGKYTEKDLLEKGTAIMTPDRLREMEAVVKGMAESGGEPGNPVAWSDAKAAIADSPSEWSYPKVRSFSKQQHLNNKQRWELFDYLHTWEERLKSQREDPDHFTKTPLYHTFKESIGSRLGFTSAIQAVLSPAVKRRASDATRLFDEAVYPYYEQHKKDKDFSWMTMSEYFGKVADGIVDLMLKNQPLPEDLVRDFSTELGKK
jgi:CRISPR/Cas system CSM-associated protein Csm2 small subunit